MTITIEGVRKILRHRYPMLMIDKVIDLEPGQSIKAVKNVTINEEFFQGHFPNCPIMPGVLIVEAMAQAAGVLAISDGAEIDEEAYCLLTSIDKARFKRPVVPGDTLLIEAWEKQRRKNFCAVEARVQVQSVKVASAILHFAQAGPAALGASAKG